MALAVVMLAAVLTGCFRIYDGPPKDDGTPEPPAHSGLFESEYGTMCFSGDGRTVTLDLGAEMAALTGLPEGKSDAEYMFMANTPPHTYEYRYDRANEFRITADGVTVLLYNRMGVTDGETISLYFVDGDSVTDLVFRKVAEN